jgi:hypothetical protein
MFKLNAIWSLALLLYSANVVAQSPTARFADAPSHLLARASATLQPAPTSAVVPAFTARVGPQPQPLEPYLPSPASSSPRNVVPTAAPANVSDRDEDARAARQRRAAWLLSLEAVTHAPVDLGAQLGVETPPGIRLFAGYGWVPETYMDLLTGVAAGASGNVYAKALLDEAEYTGRTWRVQLGWRPFRKLGLYGDFGYARLRAKGALDLSSTNVPQLAALGGGYRADTRLDMWLVELGYQAQLVDRLVLGLAVGAMGTFESTTTISSVDGAPSSTVLGDAARQGDAALESYGIVPTLTLRLGFDFI